MLQGAAEPLAGEAVAITKRTDSPVFQARRVFRPREVLEAAFRREEAVAAWGQALERYERKEVVPLARRVRERLAALQPA
jgi:hypothetical protein